LPTNKLIELNITVNRLIKQTSQAQLTKIKQQKLKSSKHENLSFCANCLDEMLMFGAIQKTV